MKANVRLIFAVSFLASSFLLSCKDEISDSFEAKPHADESSMIAEVEVSFSKALARAMEDQMVREFVKTEALKKFNGDYDVLYAFVKDKQLKSGETFEQNLLHYSNPSEVDKWHTLAPLMTIFVPNLRTFTPSTWNIVSQIPAVVIADQRASLDDNTFRRVRSNNQDFEVLRKKAPDFPVVIVKQNERVLAKDANRSAKYEENIFEKQSTKPIGSVDNFTYYFVADADPKEQEKSASNREERWENLAPMLTYGASENVENQRDWVYYHIAPKFENEWLDDYNFNEGNYGNYYRERITGFKFDSELAANIASDGWHDGAFEFQITHIQTNRSGSPESTLKVMYCEPQYLIDDYTPKEYNPNIELIAWDMYNYGTDWKFAIVEHDDGATTTKTVSSKSTFGFNFTISGVIKKIGLNLGLSGSNEKSSSTVVASTDASEDLGVAEFRYDDKVLVTYTNYPGNVGKWTVNNHSSGAVTLTIEPVLMAGHSDPRPTPHGL